MKKHRSNPLEQVFFKQALQKQSPDTIDKLLSKPRQLARLEHLLTRKGALHSLLPIELLRIASYIRFQENGYTARPRLVSDIFDLFTKSTPKFGRTEYEVFIVLFCKMRLFQRATSLFHSAKAELVQLDVRTLEHVGLAMAEIGDSDGVRHVFEYSKKFYRHPPTLLYNLMITRNPANSTELLEEMDAVGAPLNTVTVNLVLRSCRTLSTAMEVLNWALAEGLANSRSFATVMSKFQRDAPDNGHEMIHHLFGLMNEHRIAKTRQTYHSMMLSYDAVGNYASVLFLAKQMHTYHIHVDTPIKQLIARAKIQACLGERDEKALTEYFRSQPALAIPHDLMQRIVSFYTRSQRFRLCTDTLCDLDRKSCFIQREIWLRTAKILLRCNLADEFRYFFERCKERLDACIINICLQSAAQMKVDVVPLILAHMDQNSIQIQFPVAETLLIRMSNATLIPFLETRGSHSLTKVLIS